MRVRTKETTLSDGSKVHDINLFPNGGGQFDRKVIISCHSEEAADKFLSQLQNLIDEYSVESLDFVESGIKG